MINLFHLEDGLVRRISMENALDKLPEQTVWIDLYNPLVEEEKSVEKLLNLEIPNREEMQEIEDSSRLYVDGDALVMTLSVVTNANSDNPQNAAITFVLAHKRLVTVRYANPTPFDLFMNRINRQPAQVDCGERALMGLLEQIADRLADILENASNSLEDLSHSIFRPTDEAPNAGSDFQRILRRIGKTGDLVLKIKDSLLSINRLTLFFAALTEMKKDAKTRVDTLTRDVNSLDKHSAFVSEKVSFLLNATLGMINIEQNNIIKIFSVAAVAFLPPTLIASIYGMNFHSMPELNWHLGYPLAIGLMVLSALLPFYYFKRKKWL